MQLAILFGVFLVVVALFMHHTRRGRFSRTIPSTCQLRTHDAIARIKIPIEFRNQSHYVFKKLIHEIKIFNAMRVVMPHTGRSITENLKILGRLHIDPKCNIPLEDPYTRLFYAYSSLTLHLREKDFIRRRQLLKNSLPIFVNQLFIKQIIKINKIITKRYYPCPQPLYKLLGGEFLSRQSESNYEIKVGGAKEILNTQFSDSYILQYYKDILVKSYVDKHFPVKCFELKTNKKTKFIWKTNMDKLELNMSQTADIFYYICHTSKRTFAIYVPDVKKMFGTNMTSRNPDLEIHITIGTDAKIYVVNGTSKAEVQSIIQKLTLADSRLDYLLNDTEINANKRIQNIITKMHNAKSITGEGLRKKYLATTKIIPTLYLPTLTYVVESQEDFFAIIDNFDNYERLASLKIQFNIIILFSSQNHVVREIIAAFTNTREVYDLINLGIFMFFVDKMTTHTHVVNFLSHMNAAQEESKRFIGLTAPTSNHKKIIVATDEKNGSQNIFVTSSLNKSMPTSIFIPMDISKSHEKSFFALPSVIKKQSGGIKITSQKTGHSYILQLQKGVKVYTSCGLPIDTQEYQTDKLIFVMETVLKPYEEKIFEIKKSKEDSKEEISCNKHKICKSEKNKLQHKGA
ncbi:MAG: hypothetical protein FWE16_01415 [Firmicutes bacterium]|nr:hypothetical protein [Bacillota bacterium]